MAIYTERTIKVNNNKASMDKDIYVYRGNRNIDIEFSVVEHLFKFRDVNLIERISPSHAYVTLLTPQMKQVSTGKGVIEDNKIKLTITSAMIDEKTEIGDYAIVIDLYDEDGDALVTIPPVENQLHVLDRMTEIKDIPDELRFQFDEQTGNLNVTNIDLTYTGDGEIRTIEGIPVSDDKARRIMADLQETVNEFSSNFDPALADIAKAKDDIVRIDGIVTELSDNGYSQIKANMNQTQIQNVLNNGGLILWRSGTYNLTAGLNLVSNTRILAETRVELVLSGGNAISLNDISDVHVDGNLILNGAGFSISNSKDVVVNNLCVSSAENGLVIVGGDNVVINNLITQECTTAGCRISNGSTATNVILDNHVDIQSAKALDVLTASNTALAGRVHIIKPFYEVSDGSEPCMKINNSINAPRLIIDKANIQANVNKDVIISIIKEDDNTQKLGNVEILEPHLMGEGTVGAFIKVENTRSPGNVAKIKIVKPERNVNGSAAIRFVDSISNNRSIIIDANNDIIRELSGNVNIGDDLCSMYMLPSTAGVNANINLNNAPVNFVCEFVNNSTSKAINISGSIDKKTNVELKYNDYMKIKHLGGGNWTILDENFKNKMITITPTDGLLNVINARYLDVQLNTEVTMSLPNVSDNLSEIHLFVRVQGDGSIVYPETIKWTNKEPTFSEEGVYELILTYVKGIWLIGCVSYE